jgi:hypothetical protein
MATVLKIKLAIGTVALIVLTSLAILETNFFAATTITRWRALSWNDFAGMPRPFGSFGAAVHSSVYLEYDSSLARYVAYAGQNNIRSWVRPHMIGNDYALDHEQCHFNITELHARKLNKYINLHPEKQKGGYASKLKSIIGDLAKMQDQYDDETDHGIIYDKQRRWEFTIDSLLTLEKGWTTDKFSGARSYFSFIPDSSSGIGFDGLPYRVFSIEKYGMHLAMTSFQPETRTQYEETISRILDDTVSFPIRLRSFSHDTAKIFRAYFSALDSNGISKHTMWIGNGDYLCRARVSFPNDTGDTTGYFKIASSFLNSLSLVNTNDYWISRSKAVTESAPESAPVCGGILIKRPTIFISSPQSTVFFRKPFYRSDGALLIAYHFVNRSDTEIQEDMLMLDKKKIYYCPSSSGQVFSLPPGEIPWKPFKIDVGYFLREDSAMVYYGYYHQRLSIDPSIR